MKKKISFVLTIGIIGACSKFDFKESKKKNESLSTTECSSYQNGDTLYLIGDKGDTAKIVSDVKNGIIIKDGEIHYIEPKNEKSGFDTLGFEGKNGIILIYEKDIQSLTDAQCETDWSLWPSNVKNKALDIIDTEDEKSCFVYNIYWDNNNWQWINSKIETPLINLGNIQTRGSFELKKLRANYAAKWCWEKRNPHGNLISAFGAAIEGKTTAFLGRSISVNFNLGGTSITALAEMGLNLEAYLKFGGRGELSLISKLPFISYLKMYGYGSSGVAIGAGARANLKAVTFNDASKEIDVQFMPFYGEVYLHAYGEYRFYSRKNSSTIEPTNSRAEIGIRGRISSKIKWKVNNQTFETNFIWFNRNIKNLAKSKSSTKSKTYTNQNLENDMSLAKEN